MKLSTKSIIAYSLLAIFGLFQLALTFGALGPIFGLLLFAGGAPMLLVAAYGISRRRNISQLPLWHKIAVGVATLSLLCAITLMVWIIVAFRHFQ